MQRIKLSNSAKEILVDEEDFNRISGFKWRGCGPNKQTIVRTLPPQKTLANFIMNKYNVSFDHKDNNPYNFQKENLREATQAQNMMNASKQDRFFNPCTSKYKGVYFNKNNNTWRARIYKNYVKYEIGSFPTEEIAAIAYNKKALELFGEFANLNKISNTQKE